MDLIDDVRCEDVVVQPERTRGDPPVLSPCRCMGPHLGEGVVSLPMHTVRLGCVPLHVCACVQEAATVGSRVL